MGAVVGKLYDPPCKCKQRIESINIKSPKQLVMEHAQRLDDLGRTMSIIVNAKISAVHQKMEVVSAFPNVLQNRMASLNQAVAHLGQRLNSLSYKSVLSRGYAIVRGENNQIISHVDGGMPKSIEFADGVVQI